jgi:hypothetical protein
MLLLAGTSALSTLRAQAAPAYTPTLSVSVTTAGPGATLRITGSGFKPSDGTYFYMGTDFFCSTTSDTSGGVRATCAVPPLPYGSYTLSGQQENDTIAASVAFTEKGRLTSENWTQVSPGGSLTIAGGGLNAMSTLKTKVDSTVAVETPTAAATDTTGSFTNVVVTVPAATAAGVHTLTVSDSGTPARTEATSITVYTPAVTAAAAHAGQSFIVRGTGFVPSTAAYLYSDGSYFCSATTDTSGAFASSCTMPSQPGSSHTLVATSTNTGVSAATALTSTPTVTSIPSTNLSPGVTFSVDAAGFAASSALTAKISGSSAALATTPVSPTSDSNGTINGLAITLPTTGLAVGVHTLSITDASGGVAATTVTIYAPTLKISANSGGPTEPFTVSGTGWRPGDPVYFYLRAGYFFSTTANGSGVLSGSFTLPATPAGLTAIVGQQDSAGVTVSAPFTVVPVVSYLSSSSASPGALLSLNVGGLNAGVGFTLKAGRKTLTTGAVTSTDTNGSANSVSFTLPSTTAAGPLVLTIKDTGSPAESVTTTVQVYAATITFSPASTGPGGTVEVTGSGWRPGDTVYANIKGGTVNSSLCQPVAAANGSIDALCTVPAAPHGSYSLTGQQDSAILATSTASLAVVGRATYAPYQTVSAAGSIPISAGGLAASSPVTVKIGTTTLGLVSGSPSTDTSGSVGQLVVALPATLAAGSATLTITDGAGNVVTVPLTVLAPSVVLSDSKIAAGSVFSVNATGFTPNATAILYLRGTYFCSLSASGDGDVSGSCTIPTGTASGSAVLAIAQNGGAVNVPITITVS